jgi:hypothetical protein
MPLYIAVPRGEGEEPEVQQVELPRSQRTEEEIAMQRMRFADDARTADMRYASLVQKPTRDEATRMNEETRRQLDEERQQKAEVPNVVTTHSDIAKVASGPDASLVPTHEVYRHADPVEEADSMPVTDRTVNPNYRIGGSTPELDRAERTLAQPAGDEYSSISATGPALPVGQAAEPEGEQKKVADADPQKERERSQQEVQKVGDAGHKAAQKDAPKQQQGKKGGK